MRNYVLEGELQDAALRAGALESSLADFALDVQVYRVTDRSEIAAFVAQAKVDFPHRFAIQSDHDAELCRAAFIDKNKTAESRLYLAVGAQRYIELKTLYSNGLPESEKKKLNGSTDHAQNPWSSHPDNLDARGKYNAKAIGRQCQIVKSLGEAKATSIAASVSSKLGDTGPRRVA